MATLFEECLLALADGREVMSSENSDNLFKGLTGTFPFTKWGVIEWEKVNTKFSINSITDVENILKSNLDNVCEEVYILWNDHELPVVKAKLDIALKALDDITAVSFDTWMMSIDGKYVIEFHHEGSVTIGIH